MHPSEPERLSNVGGEEMIATLDQATSDVMNVSILSSDGSTVIEQSMEVVDMDTSILEVYDPEPQGSEVPAVVEPIYSHADQDGYVASSGMDVSQTEMNDGEEFNFLQDLEKMAQQREMEHEKLFKNKVLTKLSEDIKSRTSKRSAAKFLYDSFGESLNDYTFIRWLAKKLKLKPCRLKDIVNNAHKEFAPRHSMPSTFHQGILNYWLKEENSIISNDRRNGRDVVRIPKLTYLSKYGGLSDPNIEEEDVLLKKANKVKHHVKAPRMVYTKSLDRLHLDFLKAEPEIICSRSTFFKFKPFYIEQPTEREKQSCLCIVCQNAHTKLEGINTFRRMEKLRPIVSASEYLLSQKSEDLDPSLYPERTSKKKVNYYVFETVLEKYVKDGKESIKIIRCVIFIQNSFQVVIIIFTIDLLLITSKPFCRNFETTLLENTSKWTFHRT